MKAMKKKAKPRFVSAIFLKPCPEAGPAVLI